MLSKSLIQFVKSLHRKKFREEYKMFIAEGPTMVEEAIKSGYVIDKIFTNTAGRERLANFDLPVETDIAEVSDKELERISLLKQPHEMLSVVNMKEKGKAPTQIQDLTLALDHISDPGNLGTIIRIADWFGIETIVCSENTVEVYNPKVVQASMGSVFRVNVYYCLLSSFLNDVKEHKNGVNIYGTILKGKNIYGQELSPKGVIVIGNESRGVSAEILEMINVPLTIPTFEKKTSGHAESLNAAIATAIICSEFRRRSFKS